MAQRYYPKEAPRGGTTTLTGNGSASDEFTFQFPVTIVVENNTGSAIQIAMGASQTALVATQGNFSIPAGAEYVSEDTSTWVSVYGVAATTVNGTTAAGIVIMGVA